MTGAGPPEARDFGRESSRIGLNLASLVASRFFCLALSIVQVGIILRALPIEGRGQFGYALSFPKLFTVFATLGIQRLIVRDIARDPRIAWTHVWTAAAVVTVLSTMVTAVIMGSILVIEDNPVMRAAVFMATLSVIVLWAVQRPFEGLLIAKEKMVYIAVINIVAGAARLGSVWVAMGRAPSSAAAHGAIAVGNLIGFGLMVAAAIAVAGWERPRLRLSLVFAQIRETIPFSFSIFFSMIYFMSDMAILKWRLGETAAGVYTPAQRIIEPLLMVAGIWGTAVFPALCRFSVNDPDAYTRLKKTSARLALLVAFPIGFGIAFLAEPIMALLTGENPSDIAETVFVLRLLCVVTPFFYFNAVGQEFLYSAHRNWFVAGSYGCAAVISVTMNVLLIPRLGVPAVAVTAIAANVAVSAAFVWGMQHEYGAMGLIALLARTVLACAVMGLAAYLLAPVSLVLGVAVGGLVYVALQFVLRTLTPEERRLMLHMAQDPLRRLTGRGA